MKRLIKSTLAGLLAVGTATLGSVSTAAACNERTVYYVGYPNYGGSYCTNSDSYNSENGNSDCYGALFDLLKNLGLSDEECRSMCNGGFVCNNNGYICDNSSYESKTDSNSNESGNCTSDNKSDCYSKNNSRANCNSNNENQTDCNRNNNSEYSKSCENSKTDSTDCKKSNSDKSSDTKPSESKGKSDSQKPTVSPTSPTEAATEKSAVPSATEAKSENGYNLNEYEKQVVTLINEIRAENGLNPLEIDTELSKVARIKSQDMKNKGYFSHQSPTYGSPFEMMTSFGIRYRTAGENIAKGYQSPESVVNGWMNSEGHRRNILNANFTKIGIGYVQSGSYWTQMFIG